MTSCVVFNRIDRKGPLE